jgi:PAS domain-containing protein
MEPNRELGTWLLGQRKQIERSLNARLGPAAPGGPGPEAETLRRFRTFVSTALMRGQAPPPALDGLRPNERRVMALLGAWTDSASALAGPRGNELRAALEPLLEDFRMSLRGNHASKQKKRKPQVARRAVSAAIDRVVDGFLAIDVHEAEIVDANPAVGILLGVEKDTLFGVDLMSFVPGPAQPAWWSHLDAVSEDGQAARFSAPLQDVHGHAMTFEVSATRFATRGRTLALLLLRPALESAATNPEEYPAPVPNTAKA